MAVGRSFNLGVIQGSVTQMHMYGMLALCYNALTTDLLQKRPKCHLTAKMSERC